MPTPMKVEIMTLPPMPQISATGENMTGPAIRTFFRISEVWALTPLEQMQLLGISDRRLLRSWKDGVVRRVQPDTLERISFVIGIFQAINTLLPQPDRADAWMRSPNSAPLFGGASAIEQMTRGGIDDLRAVRRYLNGQLTSPG